MCIFRMILGAGFIIGGILLGITWLSICFGSIILGLVLLIFAPHILLIPFTLGFFYGFALIASCNEVKSEIIV